MLRGVPRVETESAVCTSQIQYAVVESLRYTKFNEVGKKYIHGEPGQSDRAGRGYAAPCLRYVPNIDGYSRQNLMLPVIHRSKDRCTSLHQCDNDWPRHLEFQFRLLVCRSDGEKP
jgi:hypothetical protein